MQDQEIIRQLNIVLVGPKHAGKTIFLTALANCSSISIEDQESIVTLHENWKMLQKGETPPATSGTLKDIHFAYRSENDGTSYNVNIVISDYDGHFAETLSQDTEEIPEKKALCQKIREANGFLIFFPSADDHDLTTMEELRMEIGYFISMLRNVYSEDESIATPAVLAVNKWDKNEAFQKEHEDKAAEEHIKSFEIYRVISDKLKNFFSDLTILPMSAYGHKTPDENPVPGLIHPYRIDEGIHILVRQFFKNFQKCVSALETDDQPVALAQYLLRCAPLWSRCEGFDYSSMLANALDRSFESLYAKVQNCTTLHHFQSSFSNAPERVLLEDFSPEQQQQLMDIRQKLKEKENRKHRRLGVRVLFIIALLSAGGYLGYLHHMRAEDYTAAMNSTASVNERLNLLISYEEAYSNNPFMLGLYKKNLADVRVLRDSLVKKLREDFAQDMERTQTTADACERAALAGTLLARSQYIEPALTEKIQTLFQQSQAICQCRSALEEPQNTLQDLARLRLQLCALPASEEVNALLARLNEKSQKLHESNILLELDKLYPPTQDNDGYDQAQQLLAQYANEPSENVKAKLETIRLSLGERLYCAILHRISEISDHNMERSTYELKEFLAREGGKALLSEEYKKGIRSAMQSRVERIDRSAVESIGREILSLNDLADREETLRRIDERLANVNLDYGLFRYQRPWDLASRVNDIQKEAARYKNALTYGIDVEWNIYVREGNPLKAGCGFIDNDDISFVFSASNGRTISGSAAESQCYTSDLSGFAYYFSFGTKTILPASGSITITQEDFIGMLKDQSAVRYLNITEEDIFSLLKSYSGIQKSLGQDFTIYLRRR